jgi:hypothetical protein
VDEGAADIVNRATGILAPVAQCRLIRTGITDWNASPFRGLLNEGSLADLARTRHDLNEPSGFGEPPGQLGRLRPFEGLFRFTRVY